MTPGTEQAIEFDTADRAADLYEAHRQNTYRRTDRVFGILMAIQWAFGICAALVISPRTWIGAQSTLHPHVWVAVILGGAISILPILLAMFRPGHVATRYVIAVAQMLWSALLIHLTGGRIETHFHVFGSLAFLAFYRDWRVLVPATVVVALDHVLRGVYFPQSVYGVLGGANWRWLEHASWVIFEDIFLIVSCARGQKEMLEIAHRAAELEAAQAATQAINEQLEYRVIERTAEIERRNAEMAAIHQTSLDSVFVLSADWTIVSFNPAAERAFQCAAQNAVGHKLSEFIVRPDSKGSSTPAAFELDRLMEVKAQRPDRTTFPAEIAIAAAALSGPPVYIAFLRDLTERKKAEAERDALNKQLLSASRHAGMAEVATGVLHNVGNVLNSVNISAKVVAEKIKQSELPSLMKVSDMIRAHRHDLPAFLVSDERGKLVPEFISDLAECLGEEQRHMLVEVSALANGIEHIKQIVAAQQRLAKKSNVTTASDPVELMETALTMQKGPDGEIEIIRKFGDGVLVALDQHKVIQILVNLISNARHAVKASGVDQKRIVLGVEVIQTDQAAGRARFEVQDNGVGISHENLSRIFAHGFTTKSNGHGFGLHSAANAAKELGGSLTVHSDGPGKGAIFTLDIPVTSERAGATCKL